MTRLAFIGGGTMAEAMIRGLLEMLSDGRGGELGASELVNALEIVSRRKAKDVERAFGVPR